VCAAGNHDGVGVVSDAYPSCHSSIPVVTGWQKVQDWVERRSFWEVDVVFGRGKPQMTHRQQLLDELGQSYGHLKLAAGQLAGGTAEKITPPYDRARNVASRGWGSTRDAFAPIYAQMRDGAANARQEVMVVDKRNRWPMFMGLLAAGAAVGAAGALVSRRRKAAQQWDEFEPALPLDEAGFPITGPTGAEPKGSTKDVYAGPRAKDKMSSATKKAAAGAATVAESVSAQADKLADSLHEKASRPAGSGTGSTAVETPAASEEKTEKTASEKAAAAKSAAEKAAEDNSRKP
jgi:hypothetical protein